MRLNSVSASLPKTGAVANRTRPAVANTVLREWFFMGWRGCICRPRRVLNFPTRPPPPSASGNFPVHPPGDTPKPNRPRETTVTPDRPVSASTLPIATPPVLGYLAGLNGDIRHYKHCNPPSHPLP